MVRHIVTWNYKDEISEDKNKENALKVKAELESLSQYITGVVELKVYINVLSSSNKDILLNSLFESEQALAAYQVHPEHKRVSAFVGSVTQNRVCIDYYE